MNNKKYLLGIDLGSNTVKTALLSRDGELLDFDIRKNSFNINDTGEESVKSLLERNDITVDRCSIAATGYGRILFKRRDREFSEITCHGRGTVFLHPDCRTIIDVGGQDAKAISVNGAGKVLSFAMNDKCAAGTGRFLEVMANVLGTSIADLSWLALKAEKRPEISSTCTVFAESEVVSLIARGVGRNEIARGVIESIASRFSSLLHQVEIADTIYFTGGVALIRYLQTAIEKILKRKVVVPENPQITAAVGAALMIACLDPPPPAAPSPPRSRLSEATFLLVASSCKF